MKSGIVVTDEENEGTVPPTVTNLEITTKKTMDSTNNGSNKLFHCKNFGCLFTCYSPLDLSRHKCSSSKKRKIQRSSESGGQEVLPPINMDILEQNDTATIDVVEHTENNGEEVEYDLKSNVLETFCKIIAHCSDYKTLKVLKEVISLLHNEHFDLALFKSQIKTLESCREYVSSKFSERAAKDGFKKNVVECSDGKEIHKAEFFQRDIITVLQNQIAAASETDMLLTPQKSPTSRITHPLQSPFFYDQYMNRKEQVMKDFDSNLVWYDETKRKSFVGFLQIFTDKTVTSLKVGSVTAYVVHVTLLNATKKFRRKLIQSGKTIVGFLPTGVTEIVSDVRNNTNSRKEHEIVDMEVEVNGDDINDAEIEQNEMENQDEEIVQLLDKVLLTSNARGRITKLALTHKAMRLILQPLLDVSTFGFELNQKNITLLCHPLLISYCCDIPEAKDMSAVRHNLNTNCPCHRCLTNLSSIQSFRKAKARLYKDTFKIRMDIKSKTGGTKSTEHNEECEETNLSIEETSKILKEWSLSPKPSFLEDIIQEYPRFIPINMYDIFTYEPLHNLHLGISKMLKTLTYEIIGSSKYVLFPTSKKKEESKISSQKTAILRACNSLLRAIQIDSSTTSMKIDFSTKETSSTLNGIFLETGVRGMLEGKDYKTLDYVFPFVAAFVDRITGCQRDGITAVHTLYSELLKILFDDVETYGLGNDEADKVEYMIDHLKKECKKVFGPYVEKGMYTLKFHLLDHLVPDLKRYGSLDVLDGGPYEYFNTVVKLHYRLTSKRKSSALEETVQRMSTNLLASETDRKEVKDLFYSVTKEGESDGIESRQQYLVRDGITISFRHLKAVLETPDCSTAETVRREIQSALPEVDNQVLIELIEKEVMSDMPGTIDCDIKVTVVKTGFIHSFRTPTILDFNTQKCKVIYKPNDNKKKTRKRIFATSSFGPSKKPMHSTIFMKGKYDENDEYEFWFGKTLLLFRISCEEKTYSKEFALVKFFTCCRPTDNIDKILGCICLRWETEDGLDHSNSVFKDKDTIRAGEQYGLIPFQSICGTCQVIRSNYGIHPYSEELPWTHHKFYVNRFHS